MSEERENNPDAIEASKDYFTHRIEELSGDAQKQVDDFTKLVLENPLVRGAACADVVGTAIGLTEQGVPGHVVDYVLLSCGMVERKSKERYLRMIEPTYSNNYEASFLFLCFSQDVSPSRVMSLERLRKIKGYN